MADRITGTTRAIGAASASDAPDHVAIGPGSGCTLREIQKRLKAFAKRRKLKSENWKAISDSSKRAKKAKAA